MEAWVPLQVLALLKQGKRQEAMGIVREARHAAGQAWPELSNAIRSQNPVEESVPSSISPSGGDPKQQRLEWEALLQLPKLRESPPPVPPAPLRVVLLGHPVWEKDWQRLRSAPALDDWEPGLELGWEGLELKEERDLRGREGWSEDSRWVLLRGDQVLDFGTDGLTPDALADRLRAFGEPYLVQLERFLKRHPDHREALADWGLTFWKGGLHEAFIQAKGHPVDPENRPLGSSDLDRMQKELIHPAREALRRTGRLEALRVWDQDFAALNVSLPMAKAQ